MKSFSVRSLSLWMTMLLFSAMVASVPLVHFFKPTRRRTSAITVPEFANELKARYPDLRVVAVNESGDFANGVYLCEPTFQGNPRKLARLSERARQWRGVVLVEAYQPDGATENLLADWGDYAALAPPFLLFGDPILIQRIK
jgi:hypothetical protein